MIFQQSQKSVEKVRADYDRIAPHYALTRDYPRPESNFFFKPYIRANQKFLDIGCGSGREYLFLKKLNIPFSYTGIDISPAQIAEAKKRFPEGDFRMGTMLQLPFEAHNFDVAFMAASFHHLACKADRLQALREASRILKPDGILCMINWNLWQRQFVPAWITNIVRSIVSFGTYSWRDFFIPWKNNRGEKITDRYYHALTKREMATLAQQTDFTVLENFYTNREKKVTMWRARNLVTILQKKHRT